MANRTWGGAIVVLIIVGTVVLVEGLVMVGTVTLDKGLFMVALLSRVPATHSCRG
jgi:hypothetical protein